MKFNNTNKRALTWIAVLIAVLLAISVMRSGYSPRPIVIKQSGDFVGKSIFGLKNDVKCVPHARPGGSAYTKGLTPGGLCGAQQLVREQATYEIEDGIGGALI
jgi:hypothetical protein